MSYKDKILPSGILIENRPTLIFYKYRWHIKGTDITHNEVEPAFEYNNGSKFWYQYGICHRLDGPAIEYANGDVSYYIDDVSYREEDYWKHPDVKTYQYLKEHPELKAFT